MFHSSFSLGSAWIHQWSKLRSRYISALEKARALHLIGDNTAVDSSCEFHECPSAISFHVSPCHSDATLEKTLQYLGSQNAMFESSYPTMFETSTMRMQLVIPESHEKSMRMSAVRIWFPIPGQQQNTWPRGSSPCDWRCQKACLWHGKAWKDIDELGSAPTFSVWLARPKNLAAQSSMQCRALVFV